ncbi:MAG: arginine--tRNA ligase [Anaerolineales bacterium]|nr:arginine--tRNA ligase [Anaerolineales bacterium]
MFEDELKEATQSIEEELEIQDLPQPEEVEWSPIPFSGRWGFGSAVCFQVAAQEARMGNRINVPERAQEIAKALTEQITLPAGFSHIEAERGYINLYIDTDQYAQRVVDTVLDNRQEFGKGDPIDERVMVEYSQPNTHKAFHVGHLRNVILGGSMANIIELAGYDTIRANYIGDIGWHVVKWLWCYLRFHKGEQPTGDRTRWMQEIYSEASRLVDENPEFEAEARAVFRRWDERDPEVVDLWNITRQWSIEGFMEIYEALNESFDVIFYESEVEEESKRFVEDLIERGLATDERPSGGTVVIKLDEILGEEKENYRVLVLLRSDGTSLYGSKDLPLAVIKFEEWNVDRSIYVIDVRQSLYLRQVFKTLELMGFEQAKNCYHLSYEIVNLPGDVTMSSREGTVVMFDDLIREANRRAAAIVEEKNPSLSPSEKEEVSGKVALGAIKYPLLAVDNNKTATFDWDRALDFEGQASPYIQYAHVRASSILAKASGLPESCSPGYSLETAEIQLLDRISRFPELIQRSAQDYKPLNVANYAYDLAKDFTEFYQRCPVLKTEEGIRRFRLRVTAAARQTISNSLELLGIPAPDFM